MSLISPGVLVSTVNESAYAPAATGTIPLIVFATASNKTASSGSGIAPGTVPSQAGQLYLVTSQRDLIQTFGNPTFYSVQGTPVQGYELNEYGLHAAYSYLGMSNRAYVLRADIDLAQLAASEAPPVGEPISGTYWFDIGSTSFGIFQSNGNAIPGSAWVSQSPLVVNSPNSVDVNDVPLSSFGANGNFAVVTLNDANIIYEKINGLWYRVGSSNWVAQRLTIVRGSTSPTLVTLNNTIIINGVTVTFGTPTVTTGAVSEVAVAINNAAIPNITASVVSGGLVITNTVGGNITINNGTGTALTALGLTSGITNGVTTFYTNDASYPANSVVGDVWIKGSQTNRGANYVVKLYNAATAQFVIQPTPLYPFSSTLSDGTAGKDSAAIAALGSSPNIGTLYVGYDPTQTVQQIRIWTGSIWEALTYEASLAAPTTNPPDGTLYYNTNFQVDIMYGNGENWLGYRHHFPNTDPMGVIISGSAPTTQQDGVTALADQDIWLDSSDTENYPSLYRYNATLLTWTAINKTDNTSPFGIVFDDARATSGPTFTGIINSGNYTYNSTNIKDLVMSDFVDPDCVDPRLYPAGMLLFNTRYSTYNVKQYESSYFLPGGFDPNDNFVLNSYTVGSSTYTFPPTTSARWVTASGNKTDGSPYMGRKAQRIMIVRALAEQFVTNQNIRSELVYFNLIACPGYPELIGDMVELNDDIAQVAFVIGDTPVRLDPSGTSIQAWAENAAAATGDGEDALVTHSDYAGVYYPWGLGTDLSGNNVMIPPSTIVLRTYAYNDQVAYPWYAPAGYTRGLVDNATSVGFLNSSGNYQTVILNQGQRDVLYGNSINPIAYIPNKGLVVYGQKTLSSDTTALDRINVARLQNYLNYNLDNILKPFLFEQNTATTRSTVQITVERFLNGLISLNGISDFGVVCDTSNNTTDRIDRNELWLDIAYIPTRSIEFIYVPVRIVNDSTQINNNNSQSGL